LSSTESEIVALSLVCQEIIWLNDFLKFLMPQLPVYTDIHCDNTSTIQAAKNTTHHSRLKHIALRQGFVNDFINQCAVNLHYVPSKQNIADLLTKAPTTSYLDTVLPLLLSEIK
jgi:hypothetical protein